VFGSVAADGRGRVEVIQARQDSAGFEAYLAALEERHHRTGRDIILALDNGPAHTSQQSRAALAQRRAWLEVIWLARYSPELNPKEREWKQFKRDVRSHLAADLPTFVDDLRAGLDRLGGAERQVVDLVPNWWLAGHRKPPAGRPPGRPKGVTDSAPRQRRAANLPAST
jgi:hypothetical protein